MVEESINHGARSSKINQKYSQDDVLEGEDDLNQKGSGGYSKLQSNGCRSPKAQIFHMDTVKKEVE